MFSLRKAVDPNIKPAFVKPEYVVEISDRSTLPADLAPLPRRIGYFFQLWAFKLVVAIRLIVFNLFNTQPEIKPNLSRTYPCRPALPVRIFFPEAHSAFPSPSQTDIKTKAATLLPLYLNIHGGAFAVCDASIDDHFCRSWSTRSDMLVASLNYSKAPLNPYPVPVHDIAAIARAVIDDETLPIDKSRIIIGGSSAGGNLALSASLLPELQSRIKAAVTYYPIVDWSHPPPVKFGNRLYTEKRSESLAKASSFLDWGYVTAGQNRREKFLSPCYASREELPPNICMIGAQHDMLCREARDMVYSLAGKKLPQQGWDQGFEEDHYKWNIIMGVKHGFTNDFGSQGKRADRRRKICDDMYADVHQWLVRKILPDEIIASNGEEVAITLGYKQAEENVTFLGYEQADTVRST